MYLQEILEVGIGLVFVWLVISVAAMSVQEWFANIFEWRSKDLAGAIQKMLANSEMAKEFYNHQIIRGLSKDKSSWDYFWTGLANKLRRLFKRPINVSELKPSYIPATDFAMTVFDMVLQAGSEASPIKQAFANMRMELDRLSLDKMNSEDKQEAQKFLDALLEEAKRIATTDIGYDSIDSVRSQILRFAEEHPEIKDAVNEILLDKLNKYYNALLDEQRLYPPGELNKDLNLKRLRIGLMAIEQTSPKLHQSLRSLLAGVEEYVDDKEKALAVARKNVESWFDNSMTRLSGWYKRKAQLVAFIIGLLTAILLNVDSINLATMLWREPTLRQAIVAEAQAYVAQNPQGPPSSSSNGTTTNPAETFANVQKQIRALSIPVGWVSTPMVYDPTITCTLASATQYDDATGKLISITGIHIKEMCYPIVNALPFTSANLLGWLTKLLGLLITGLAAAQGAPFWFDILKKLVNVRSTGANPAEEKPKG